MKEKDKIIIDEAIKLFAQKGFSQTSIQEIASNSGISKGAFYLHFKSKEALLLAILNHYHESFKKEVFEFERENLSPREKFLKQLTILFKKLLEHKEFIIMLSKEQAVPLNESTKKLIYKMHLEALEFYKKGFSSVYGQNSEIYLWDLAVIMDGIINAFNRIILFDSQFDIEKSAEYLLKRMDSIYKDLSEEKPLFTQAAMEKILLKTKMFMSNETEQINDLLSNMRLELEKMDRKEDLEISLEVIEAEISRETPRIAVIQGMLSNFSGIQNFESYVKKLSAIFIQSNKK